MALALAVAAILGTGLSTYRALRAQEASSALVRETLDTLQRLERLASVLNATETEQRGFLLTGRDEYRTPYTKAADLVASELAAVEALLVDTPSQRERLARLGGLTRTALEELAHTVRLGAEGRMDEALMLVERDEDRRTMDRIRALLREMRLEEQALLAQREQEAKRAVTVSFCVAGVGSLLLFGLVLGAALTTVHDFRERRRVEEVLARSEARFRTLVQDTSLATWTAEASGQLVESSPSWRAFTGQSPAESRGQGWLQAVHPEDRERTARAWEEALRTRGPFAAEYRLRRPDGAYRWTLARAAPVLAPDGSVREWVSANTDISERKAADDFRERLIGIVSHDLRNPLASILLTVTNLRRRGGHDARSLQALERIQSSAERAGRMVRDLLDFTQARLGGGIRLATEAVDLHAVVQQVVEELRAAHPGRPILLERQGEARGEWDPDRLAQVAGNLLANALHYSPPETEVRVETRGEADGSVLRVHNGGPPIPPEHLPHLFEPMHRAASEADRQDRSVGLGLYIVRHIVEAHGGTVEAASSPAGGTTFHVWLPHRKR